MQWNLGQVGAPKETIVRLELLLKDYVEGGSFLTQQCFNINVPDLEPTKVKYSELPVDR